LILREDDESLRCTKVRQNEEEIMGIYKKPKDALDAADELKEKQKGDYYHFHVNRHEVK
jgi:hypothetical protein